ncbi:hypothetical protein I553_6389 [Mycobacterium xenopi 4042]|uniref:Uncharacterized protein n=1 Tax=Mycobacterium xenopi 4042 TaxID=1299334 RepID=X8BF77_MYCXE|nr:hypothetical protein I553_6389 [Mycobacterium xenopi 4042]
MSRHVCRSAQWRRRETAMKGCIIAGAAALLMAASLVVSAPSARAGCLYGGPFSASAMDPSSLTAPGNVAWWSPAWSQRS